MGGAGHSRVTVPAVRCTFLSLEQPPHVAQQPPLVAALISPRMRHPRRVRVTEDRNRVWLVARIEGVSGGGLESAELCLDSLPGVGPRGRGSPLPEETGLNPNTPPRGNKGQYTRAVEAGSGTAAARLRLQGKRGFYLGLVAATEESMEMRSADSRPFRRPFASACSMQRACSRTPQRCS